MRYFLVALVFVLGLWCLTVSAAPSETTMDPEAIQEAVQRATATLRGRVVWQGQQVQHATVQVFRDSTLKQPYTEGVLIGEEGAFEIKVEPGTYYLVAFVDQNNDGTFDVGDGMGIYGIRKWNDPAQERLPIHISGREEQADLVIPISALMAQIDGKPQIIALNDPILKQMQGGFSINLQTLFTGIRGQVTIPEQTSGKALVFAYTDPSWKYRRGYAIADEEGNFEIKLPPGKYYLLFVIDEDNSGDFDAGDPFGIYGVMEASQGQLPEPVLVEPNHFTEEIGIPIVGKRPAEPPRPLDGTATVPLKGKVVWPGHALRHTDIQVYRDGTLTEGVAQIDVAADGSFATTLPSGSYYLIASVDADGDGTYSPGDAIGGYGTSDIAGFPPTALDISEVLSEPITIEISARYDSAGQLYSAHTLEGDLPGPMLDVEGSGISGRVSWLGQTVGNLILLISPSPTFESVQVFMMHAGESGEYAWSAAPGDYYLMAVADANSNRLADVEDGVGVYGTHDPAGGKPQSFSVFADRVTPYLDIEIHAAYTDMKGTVARIEDAYRSEIRLEYGIPEDLYQFTRFGKRIEEWWYWSQGIGFVFEGVGLGWKLTDTKHFDVDATANPGLAPICSPNLKSTLYYDYDQVIWGISAAGRQQPLVLGSLPTADLENSQIAFLDPDGNLRLGTVGETSGSVVVDRSVEPTDPAISPDGLYLAYARRVAKGTQLHVLHLPTGEDQPLPTAFRESATPAWSPDNMQVAYAAVGAIDQSAADSQARNLYLYDLDAQRIEPLVIGGEDDAEPAWAPDGSQVIVFSRAEGAHRQLWKVSWAAEEEPVVTQLTRYGGASPIWLPNGEQILYENNGQLWTISPDGGDPTPLLIQQQIVMGHHPFATAADTH